MRSECKATRAYLKKLSPNHADAYIKSFNLPHIYERILYYLYVKKVPDIIQVKYKLEEDGIYLSDFKVGNMHRASIEWICSELKNN